MKIDDFLIGGGGYVKDGKETFISASGELVFIPLESTYRQPSKSLLSKENSKEDTTDEQT